MFFPDFSEINSELASSQFPNLKVDFEYLYEMEGANDDVNRYIEDHKLLMTDAAIAFAKYALLRDQFYGYYDPTKSTKWHDDFKTDENFLNQCQQAGFSVHVDHVFSDAERTRYIVHPHEFIKTGRIVDVYR